MKMKKGGTEAGRIALDTWLKAALHLGLLDTRSEAMQVRADPFEEYDRKVHEEEKIRNSRVRKPRRKI